MAAPAWVTPNMESVTLFGHIHTVCTASIMACAFGKFYQRDVDLHRARAAPLGVVARGALLSV